MNLRGEIQVIFAQNADLFLKNHFIPTRHAEGISPCSLPDGFNSLHICRFYEKIQDMRGILLSTHPYEDT